MPKKSNQAIKSQYQWVMDFPFFSTLIALGILEEIAVKEEI